MSLPRIKKQKSKKKRFHLTDMNSGSLKNAPLDPGVGIYMLALQRQRFHKFKVA